MLQNWSRGDSSAHTLALLTLGASWRLSGLLPSCPATDSVGSLQSLPSVTNFQINVWGKAYLLGELRSPATPQQWRNLRNQVCNISVWVVWGGLCPFSQTLKSREFPNTGRGSRCHMAKKKNPTQTPQTTPTQTITTTIKQPKISKNKIPKISPTGVHPFGSPTVTYLLFPTFTFQKKKFLLFSWVKL